MTTVHDDEGFGCAAFGHLASAFVDGELPRTELDRYATHLPGCAPCLRLCAQYRALDVAAMPPYPRPSESEWAAAWENVASAMAADRAEAIASPAAGLLRFTGGIVSPWMRPLAAAAAAIALIGLTLAVRRAWETEPGSRVAAVTAPAPAASASGDPSPHAIPVAATGAEVLSVACLAGWEPVVWRLDGDDPMTVVQCQPIEA